MELETKRSSRIKRDEYTWLAIGGMPRWVTRPESRLMNGRSFAKLPAGDASDVLEGMFLLQWPKSGIAFALGGVVTWVTSFGPSAMAAAGFGVAIAIAATFPAYMFALLVPRRRLQKALASGDHTDNQDLQVLSQVRMAPYVAIVIAVALGLAAAITD